MYIDGAPSGLRRGCHPNGNPKRVGIIRHRDPLVSAYALILSVGAANADTFNISITAYNGQSLFGTMDLDTSSGLFNSLRLSGGCLIIGDPGSCRPRKTVAVNTAEKQRGRPFQPGESGNPFGRPKGSRNKLAEAFIADVYADWLEHGILALVRVRQPAAYLRIVAALLPQHIEVSDDVGLLSDSELDARLELVEAAIAESDGT